VKKYNNVYKYFLVIATFSFTLLIYSQDNEAKELKSKNFKRLFKVSDSIYRLEQPNKRDS